MEGGSTEARKVMVVVDPSRESAGAIQYALSHATVENDTLVLLHVENHINAWKNPFGALFRKPGGGFAISNSLSSVVVAATAAAAAEGGGGAAEVDFLDTTKQACIAAQPKLKVVGVKAEMVDGKDKASVILAQSTAHKIDLLIIGHKRTLSNAILGSIRGGSFRGLDADYLILNSKCNCVAVQKKGQNGYLLSSKTYKNFWLLA